MCKEIKAFNNLIEEQYFGYVKIVITMEEKYGGLRQVTGKKVDKILTPLETMIEIAKLKSDDIILAGYKHYTDFNSGDEIFVKSNK